MAMVNRRDFARTGAAALIVDLIRKATEEELFDEFYVLAPPEVFLDSEVRRALHEVDEGVSVEDGEEPRPKHYFRNAVKLLFKRFSSAVPDYFESAVHYYRWVRLLLHHERHIAAILREVAPGVGYFVHHLMDMDGFYDGKPFYDVALHQIPLMRKLSQASDSIFGFVAYNPTKPLAVVQSALTHGFVGVKFYPPTGYRPVGNGPSMNKLFDGANRRLFEYCSKEGIPIFTHCTPEGFESEPGMGCNADPRFWRSVLKEFENLRLCFAHAGGEEWWLDLKPNPCTELKNGKKVQVPPFGEEVIALATNPEFDNVYCEIAYFNRLQDPVERKKLSGHLREAANSERFQLRCCYGTDWMMPQMFIDGPSAYLQTLRTMFAHAELAPWQDRFFFRNGIHFLNLDGYVDRHQKYSPGFLSTAKIKALRDLAASAG